MENVQYLLRAVARGFYDTRAIIVLDALLKHHVLSDRELVAVTGVATKELRATCARLREDHLIKEVAHKEEGGSGSRAYTQTVYYIHFTEAVDAIKWKMHFVECKLKEELDHKHNAQDYVCDTCGAHYETIDALALFDAEQQQFLCGTCGSPLREEEIRTAEPDIQQDANHMEEFMIQFKPLLAALKQIDELSIPENTLESELQKHVPIMDTQSGATSYNFPAHLTGMSANSDESTSSGITTAGSADSRLPQQIQSTFNINITSEAEEAASLELVRQENKRLAEENALPEWHTQSAVNTALVGRDSGAVQATQPAEQVGEGDGEAANAMDAYFRKLQEEQGDEEDEDEGDLEDIV